MLHLDGGDDGAVPGCLQPRDLNTRTVKLGLPFGQFGLCAVNLAPTGNPGAFSQTLRFPRA
jgi:hypothetical protein